MCMVAFITPVHQLFDNLPDLQLTSLHVCRNIVASLISVISITKQLNLLLGVIYQELYLWKILQLCLQLQLCLSKMCHFRPEANLSKSGGLVIVGLLETSADCCVFTFYERCILTPMYLQFEQPLLFLCCTCDVSCS